MTKDGSNHEDMKTEFILRLAIMCTHVIYT